MSNSGKTKAPTQRRWHIASRFVHSAVPRAPGFRRCKQKDPATHISKSTTAVIVESNCLQLWASKPQLCQCPKTQSSFDDLLIP